MLMGKFLLLIFLIGVLILFNPPTPNKTPTIKSISVKPSEITPIPSNTPYLTISPTSTPSIPPKKTNLLFQYPNSSKTGEDNGQAVFISSDDPFLITSWYKEKIKTLGMNVTTFIQTNSNNLILNTLKGANGQSSIDVEISKKPNDSVVTIKVNENI